MRLSVTDTNTFIRHREPSIQKAQQDAWKFYDGIGEVHTPLNHAAKEVGKAKLVPLRYDGEPVKDDTVIDLVNALSSRVGGQAGLLRAYYLNRKIVGEGYLVGFEDGGDTFFDFVSPDELVSTDRGGFGKDGRLQRRTRPGLHSQGGADVIEDLPVGSTIIRIWNPHPRYSDLADGPLVAMNDICEELIILTCSLKSKILSRLAMSGILFLPTGLTATGPPMEPSGDPTGLSDDPEVNVFIRAGMRPINNPGSPASSMPIIIRGPDELGEAIRWISMDREIFEVDIKQRDELIRRVRDGLDIQVEVQSGMGDSNHWASWTIQDTHVKVEVAPEIESFCAAATRDYLWYALEAENYSPEAAREFYIAGDLTELVSRPNMAEDARQANDRGALGNEALLRYTGAQEADAMPDEEYVRWVGVKVRNPYLALWKTPDFDEIDWDLVVASTGKGQTGPPGEPGEEPSVGPGVGEPGAPGEGDRDTPEGEMPEGG